MEDHEEAKFKKENEKLAQQIKSIGD